ncbi:chemotaxis protein CheA [bacterium]|nr:chemotaxis protein CheA [bacterium]
MKDQQKSVETFNLPEWVGEDIFQEFIISQLSMLEEVEAELLNLESGKDLDLAVLKGRIHTMKGDTGMVGLDDMGSVYHAMEDFLEATDECPERADVLLKVKDWINNALESYKLYKPPSPSAKEIVDSLLLQKNMDKIDLEPEIAKSVSVVEEETDTNDVEEVKQIAIEQPAVEEIKESSDTEASEAAGDKARDSAESDDRGKAPSSNEPVAVSVPLAGIDRDDDMIELIGDFLEESEEGLTKADEILMDAENNANDPEMVNALFRVFHTIKGVAGFLDFNEISSLSHKSETMLDMVREGTLKLVGEVLDITFDATDMMRRMINNVHAAVENSEEVASVPELTAMLARLERTISGEGGSGTEENKEVKAKIEQIEEEEPEENTSTDKSLKKHVHMKETLRVDALRLNKLVDTIGEMVISESMVSQSKELKDITSPELSKKLAMLDKITRELQEMGTSLRMIPVKGVFQKMTRLVRDLARKSEKNIEMVMFGEDTELDKTVVDKIGDPLVHMIRNAVDHGIESSEERKKAGKPKKGTISLSAFHKGGNIHIKITDDGKGLDRDVILAKAIERGLIKSGDSLSDKEIYNLIFEPGFSTAKKVTSISGRGVGMDVVRRNIQSLRGNVEIESEKGKGSIFTIRLPLTMAIIDGMVVRVGNDRYIIPTLSVGRSVRPVKEDLISVFKQGEMLKWGDKLISILCLYEVFNIKEAQKNPTEALIVIVEDGGAQVGLLVDELIGQQQIVIKTMGESMKDTDGFSGAAIMPDGKVALILDISMLVKFFSENASEIAKEENQKQKEKS